MGKSRNLAWMFVVHPEVKNVQCCQQWPPLSAMCQLLLLLLLPFRHSCPPFDDNGYALDDRWIGRGCTFVRNVPRIRLSECLTQISGKLESGFTAECTQMGLLALLWLYTRIKPSVKITDLLPSGDFV